MPKTTKEKIREVMKSGGFYRDKKKARKRRKQPEKEEPSFSDKIIEALKRIGNDDKRK